MARLQNARSKVDKEAPIMPLFDCLYCCQEHFILNKIGDAMIQMKYLHEMDQRAYEMAKYASTKYSDLESPFTAFKQLTGSLAPPPSNQAKPRLRLTHL